MHGVISQVVTYSCAVKLQLSHFTNSAQLIAVLVVTIVMMIIMMILVAECD